MLQATVCDGVAFDALTFCEDRLSSAEVDVSRGQIVDVLVIEENLIREPEFGWGPTMLACWRAVLSGRHDEALLLFGDIGIDGPMRVAAMQSFLVECRMRHMMGGLPAGPSVSPALDLLGAGSWERILRDWAEWSRERGFEIDEAMERALGFWDRPQRCFVKDNRPPLAHRRQVSEQIPHRYRPHPIHATARS
jgi:hypothetical protein